jgi:cation-transporting P-type ATPase E
VTPLATWRLLRTNLFTFFNNILFVIGTALLVLGRPGDAVISVGIGLLNAVISSVQELLGRRKLARLKVVDGEVAVLRDGAVLRVPVGHVAAGDLLPLVAGDPIVSDGPLVEGKVEVDESPVTGEAVPLVRAEGEPLLSGTTVVGGSGTQRAEAVGEASYAGRLAARARVPGGGRTPLQMRVDLLIRLVLLTVAVISGAILGQALLDGQTLTRFVQTAAVLSGLVPYGLFLLITVAYTGAAAAIGRSGVLVQDVGAIESMSGVDVVCTDKTGTLTGPLHLIGTDVVAGRDSAEVEGLLAALVAAASAPTPVTAALRTGLPGATQPEVLDEVPLSGDLRWRALATPSATLVLGAPDVLAAAMPAGADRDALLCDVAERAAAGCRVLLFARTADPSASLRDGGRPVLPALEPLAVVALREELRSGVAETVAGLHAQGVAVKVLSGDDPLTVAAIARAAGIAPGEPVSGAQLDALPPEVLDTVVAERTVFGRLTPDHKERVVAALRHGGAHVAMIGNGVNDVPALKEADVAIAMGGGSPVTRDIADVVLAGDSFTELLPAQARGRRVIGGIVTSMHLFLARVATSALIIAVVSMLGLGFPYQPAQVGLTLFTVGLPSFFLTLWAAPQRVEDGMLAALARFVMPAALVTAVFAVGVYTFLYTRVLAGAQAGRLPPGAVADFAAYTDVPVTDPGFPVAAATLGAQTGMSIFVSVTGILLILFLRPPARAFAAWAPPAGDRRTAWLVAGLLVALTVVLSTPVLTEYFKLTRPAAPVVTAVGWAVAGWLVVQWAAFRWSALDRALGLQPVRAGQGDS